MKILTNGVIHKGVVCSGGKSFFGFRGLENLFLSRFNVCFDLSVSPDFLGDGTAIFDRFFLGKVTRDLVETDDPNALAQSFAPMPKAKMKPQMMAKTAM